MLIKKLTFILLLLLLSAGLLACPSEEPIPPPDLPERLPIIEEVEVTTVRIYYVTTDQQYLVPLHLSITATRDVATVALELLLAGPPNSLVGSVIPADTKLLDLYSIGNIIYVNLTQEFMDVTYENARLAVESILCTILPLAEGRTLQILVEGRIIDRLGSVDISAPLALPFVNISATDRALLADGYSGMILTYYLSDELAHFLVPQTMLYLPEVASAVPSTEAQARAVLERLLQSQSEDSNLWNPFNTDTELLGIHLRDEVIYVDFSAELFASGGTLSEAIIPDILLYTLCGLPGITAVQILVEGQEAYTPHGLDLSQPLSPDAPVNSIF